ncbi:MAG: hypothetical protein KDK07_16515 [Bauldia sp.]|nr:hypothetical protein [Bauldia sp.]
MALLKSINTEFGAPAQYWRVVSVSDDLLARKLDIATAGYFNEEARRAERQPMAIWQGRIEGDRYRRSPSLAEVYALLKELPDWAEAESD